MDKVYSIAQSTGQPEWKVRVAFAASGLDRRVLFNELGVEDPELPKELSKDQKVRIAEKKAEAERRKAAKAKFEEAKEKAAQVAYQAAEERRMDVEDTAMFNEEFGEEVTMKIDDVVHSVVQKSEPKVLNKRGGRPFNYNGYEQENTVAQKKKKNKKKEESVKLPYDHYFGKTSVEIRKMKAEAKANSLRENLGAKTMSTFFGPPRGAYTPPAPVDPGPVVDSTPANVAQLFQPVVGTYTPPAPLDPGPVVDSTPVNVAKFFGSIDDPEAFGPMDEAADEDMSPKEDAPPEVEESESGSSDSSSDSPGDESEAVGAPLREMGKVSS